MFVILQQGMGGMMYIEEDDLCSHDFSVSNSSAFEMWQPLLLFESLSNISFVLALSTSF